MKLPIHLLLLLQVFLATAQHFPSRQYTTTDGMPANSVFDIAQTDSRMMWFMTKAGPVYYDAKHWHAFPDSLDLPSTSNSKIDSYGDTIWVAGMGEKRFSVQYFFNDNWSKLPDVPDSTIMNNHIGFLTIPKDGQVHVYLSTRDKLYEYTPKTDIWGVYSTNGLGIYGIHELDGNVVISTAEGLHEPKDGELVQTPLPYDKFPNTEVLSILKKDSITHVLGYNWYAELRGKKLTYLLDDIGHTESSKNHQNRILVTDDGMIMTSSRSPVKLINKKNNTWRQLLIDGKNLNIGSTSIFQDAENIIWVSDSRGLFKYNTLQFINYNESSGLFGNEVSAIGQVNDTTIIAANPEGFNIISNESIVSYGLDLDPRFNNRILDIDSFQDQLYLSVNDAGLWVFNKSRLEQPSTILHGKQPQITTAEVFNDQLYAAGNHGVYRLENGKLEQIHSEGGIRNLCRVDDKLFILTNTKGIMVFDGQNFISYNSPNFDLKRVYKAVLYNNQAILATKDGLGILSDGEIKPWDRIKINSPIYGLIVDSKNRLWIGSDHGIYVYENDQLKWFDTSDGLSGNEINRNALFEDAKGQIWIGTEKGASVYRNDFNLNQEVNLNVEITSMTTSEGKQLYAYERRKIPFDYNSLNISFRCLSYISENKMNFRYRLNRNQLWVPRTSSLNDIALINLKSGNYSFEIQARYGDGSWGPSTSVNFKIDRPFYLQWWFGLIVSLLLLLIIIALFRLRFLMLIKKQEILKREVRARTAEIMRLNEQLEEKVRERTRELNDKNIRLEEYAYVNAHHLRGPLTKVMSVLQLQTEGQKMDKRMIKILNESVRELDEVIFSINDILKE